MKKVKILFVEDESLLRTLFEDTLSVSREDFPEVNFEIETAVDFTSAMDRLNKENLPDIVLLDLRLPSGRGPTDETPEKEYGFEILKRINEDPELKKVPVVVFTNLADRETEERSYALGAKAFIIKSKVVPKELFDTVLKALEEMIENGVS